MGGANKERALSNDNIFSSPKGLPYFADMAFEQVNEDNDEMEMHIDEDLQKRLSKIVQQEGSSNVNSNEAENSIFSQGSFQLNLMENKDLNHDK